MRTGLNDSFEPPLFARAITEFLCATFKPVHFSYVRTRP
jgi:hypothetical protein